MDAAVDVMVAKWRSWIEGPIRGDVVGMNFRRMIWRDVNGMLEGNPEVGQTPSAFWDFYGENYGAAQGIAVRRQADSDLAVLQRSAKDVRVYVDEHLAHDMAEPRVTQPLTFTDLHGAIDSISELFKKYAVLLTGAWWAELEPVIQDDWTAIFRVAWLPSSEKASRGGLLPAE